MTRRRLPHCASAAPSESKRLLGTAPQFPCEPKFPVIPAKPGIFVILPPKYRFCTENAEENQFVAGKFP
jgi:hypothetical protein